MRRSLSRIALEVVERNRGLDEVALVGIQRRGFPLAGRLAADLGQLERRGGAGGGAGHQSVPG